MESISRNMDFLYILFDNLFLEFEEIEFRCLGEIWCGFSN